MNRSSRIHTKAGHKSLWTDTNAHQVLLQDKPRTLAFKKAIGRVVKPGHTVLDVGCGTGILSYFAAGTKCGKIYAVDNSEFIETARETARRSGLDEKIEFFRTDIFKFRPPHKVDVVIHEQIGEYIWDEGMVKKTAFVRESFLKRGGSFIPRTMKLFMAPVNFYSAFEQSLDFWNQKPYGIDFSAVGERVFTQKIKRAMCPSSLDLKDRRAFLCRAKQVHAIDFMTVSSIPREIPTSFNLKKEQKLTGMCLYFTARADDLSSFSTAPGKSLSNWGQIFIPARQSYRIKRDSVLNFSLFPKEFPEDWKWRFSVD
jgi:predicted RNA methylase